MSESGGSARRRASSDFSIESILAKETDIEKSECRVRLVQDEKLKWYSGWRGANGVDVDDGVRYAQKIGIESEEDRWRRRGEQHQQQRRDQLEICNSAESCEASQHGGSGQFNSEELAWLRCTRYCPPKLPRKSCAGKNLKRKPGSHPRIPFTKYQLEKLENKYKSNAYLSRKDVVNLSEVLQLPQTRIKIWFQNRRARERRESQLLDQTSITRA
ncbi:hypothetical protein QAD02_004199 [Eretmocerus hayati]|uniref:Uncharacterized protein n=1 Tax=Eretmocerus hayati TaxID=131215 RepID=A0ACC2NP33_9HYME|nr:hypothetical protein QAD02_004199 [Eretmocerus hayati]